MASEAVVTTELIHATADELAAAGKTPTLELLRSAIAEKTGTKGGSFATLSPALRTWKERARVVAEPIREAAPQAIIDRLQGWTADLWAQALELANARLATEREALKKAQEAQEAETAQALATADALDTELAAVRAQLADAEAAIETAGQRIEAQDEAARTLRVELDTARAALAVEQARTAELEARTSDLKNELSHAHAEADALRAEHEATKAAAAAAAVEAAAALGRVQAERSEAIKSAEGLRAELTKVAEAAALQAGEMVAARAEVKAAGERNRVAEAQFLEDRKRNALEAQRTAEHLTRIEREHKALTAELATARETAARQSGELDALRALLARFTPATEQSAEPQTQKAPKSKS